MRLICPNCGAQYEVDAGVVPEGGRDVQCSNCGNTWFHRSSGAGSEPAAPDKPVPIAQETLQEDVPVADAEGPKRRELDPGITDILREEAERETGERFAETGGLETQTEFGLDSDDSESAAVKDRMARLRGMPGEEIGMAAAAGAARKDLLPDIEEINSTLEASSDRMDDESAEEYREKRQRSGFRRGFSVSMLLFAVLAIIYVYAPSIAKAVPQLEGAMTSYVEIVNTLRAQADNLMRVGAEKLTALLSQLTGGGES